MPATKRLPNGPEKHNLDRAKLRRGTMAARLSRERQARQGSSRQFVPRASRGSGYIQCTVPPDLTREEVMAVKKRPPKIQRPPEKSSLDPDAVRKAVRTVWAAREAREQQGRRRAR